MRQTRTRTRRWMPKAPLRLKRHGASVGVVTGQLYIAGGWDGLSSVSAPEYPVSTPSASARYAPAVLR